MELLTLSAIRSKIQVELALEDEDFVEDSELNSYINEGIDEAEAEIHAIYEDYFLNKSTLTLVNAQEEYDLPEDIYAFKIRAMIYKNGNRVYPIRRLRNWNKFEDYAINAINPSSQEEYEYLILNATAGNQKIVLSPPAQESGAYVTLWYIRNAMKLVDDDDVCDIPEFVDFVIEWGKMRCYEKEGHSNFSASAMRIEAKRKLMIDTLTTMAPDSDNEIEKDLSIYREMV
jgi:hypothetical protein